MTYEIISTGSKGNAVVLDGVILVDCGVSWKKLRPYAQKLRLVLLTHVHGDHFKPATVRALHRERPGIRWCCCPWMVEPLLEAGVSKRVIDVAEPGIGNAYDFGSVVAEETPHNVPNCAWLIWLLKGGAARERLMDEIERVFYATDAANLDDVQAPGYDWYFIEANHGEAEIEARIAAKLEAGEFAYEAAARENHMSEEQAMAWLKENMGPNSRYVLLHQHEDKIREAEHEEDHNSDAGNGN
jgi:hypothetical protein